MMGWEVSAEEFYEKEYNEQKMFEEAMEEIHKEEIRELYNKVNEFGYFD